MMEKWGGRDAYLSETEDVRLDRGLVELLVGVEEEDGGDVYSEGGWFAALSPRGWGWCCVSHDYRLSYTSM